MFYTTTKAVENPDLITYRGKGLSFFVTNCLIHSHGKSESFVKKKELFIG